MRGYWELAAAQSMFMVMIISQIFKLHLWAHNFHPINNVITRGYLSLKNKIFILVQSLMEDKSDKGHLLGWFKMYLCGREDICTLHFQIQNLLKYNAKSNSYLEGKNVGDLTQINIILGLSMQHFTEIHYSSVIYSGNRLIEDANQLGKFKYFMYLL